MSIPIVRGWSTNPRYSNYSRAQNAEPVQSSSLWDSMIGNYFFYIFFILSTKKFFFFYYYLFTDTNNTNSTYFVPEYFVQARADKSHVSVHRPQCMGSSSLVPSRWSREIQTELAQIIKPALPVSKFLEWLCSGRL